MDFHQYRSLIERFYGFYVPWEQQVYRMTAKLLPGREKVPLLLHDLRYLGSDIAALPLCPYLTAPLSQAEAFGSMYVIEGSTLGGQLISRHLQQSLSFLHKEAFAFFRSYGPDVGQKWKSFQAVVMEQLTEDDYSTVICAANQTFRMMQLWLNQPELRHR